MTIPKGFRLKPVQIQLQASQLFLLYAVQSLPYRQFSKLWKPNKPQSENIFTFVWALTKSMLQISRQLVRIALFVTVFQVVCPAFISVLVQQVPTSRETTFSALHASIVAPMLLKEKDENETESSEFLGVNNSATALLDLSSHSLNLTAAHDNIRSEFSDDDANVQPPLFTLFCSFII